ncbi:hypothetical protein KI387_016968, partial [Taxus chinensis]
AGTSGPRGREGHEPPGSAETENFNTGTVGTKGREGRKEPKEPRANQIMPRVISRKRDREVRIGRIG